MISVMLLTWLLVAVLGTLVIVTLCRAGRWPDRRTGQGDRRRNGGDRRRTQRPAR